MFLEDAQSEVNQNSCEYSSQAELPHGSFARHPRPVLSRTFVHSSQSSQELLLSTLSLFATPAGSLSHPWVK